VAAFLAATGRPREAAATLEKALQIPPSSDDALGCNDLAWILATWPSPGIDDGQRAVELAKQAVKVTPDSGNYRNTLGVAYCRAGDWNAALDALDKARERLRAVVESCSNAFFLSIAHGKLGHQQQARDYFDRGVVLLEKYARHDPGYRRFRDEACRLIGSPKPPAGHKEEMASGKKLLD
jgi:tetratricopeptide (TPR) repeat protein